MDMIPEEMQRLMQFILEHQAQFSVDMDKAKERMAESNVRLTRIEGIQENAARQIEHLGNALVALTDAHEQTREELREQAARTQEALRELAVSQTHSDRRLDALIDVVRGRAEGGQPTGPEA
jgi:chaperonin cofactor prefoldin